MQDIELPPTVREILPFGVSEADASARSFAGSRESSLVPAAIALIVSILAHAILIGMGAVRLGSGESAPEKSVIPVQLVPDPQTKRPNAKPQPSPSPPLTSATPPPEARPMPAAPPAQAAASQPTDETTPATQLAGKDIDHPPASTSGAAGTGTKDAELAALRAQVQRCWTLPPGWTTPKQVSITIDFRMNRDGTVAGQPTVIEFPATQYGIVAAKNAISAVIKCGPYRLPAAKYDDWREVQLRLSPYD